MLFRKGIWDDVASLETKISVWRQEQGKKPLNREGEDKLVCHEMKSKVYLQEGRGVHQGEKKPTQLKGK